MTNGTTTQEKLSKKSKMYYIHSAIGLAIMFLFGFLPPIDPVTPLGMKFLGIFIGLLYLWSFVDMGWPILAAFAALVTLDCMPISQIYTSAFANQTVMLCLFTMLAILPLADTGVFDYVVVWLLKKPFLKGHPWRITLVLIAIVFLANAFHLGGFAVLLMVFELTYKMCDMCGMPRSHPWCGAIIVGAVVSFVIGGGVMPFGGLPLFIQGVFVPIASFEWPFLQYVLFMFIFEFVIMFFYLLSIKLLRVDMTPLKEADISGFVKNLPPMSSYQKKAAAMFIALVACLVLAGTASLFPPNPITAIFGKLGLVGVSWIFMCFMLIWRINDRPAFGLGGMSAKVPWDSILIICIGMSFGPAIASEGTGISALLYQLTAPIFGGHSPFVFMLLVSLVTLVLTNFFNNTVVIMLMVSVVVAFSNTMELSVIPFAAIMLVASQMAMLLPGASYYAGLAHGQAAHTGRKNGFVWGAMIMISTAISIPILLMLGNIIF